MAVYHRNAVKGRHSTRTGGEAAACQDESYREVTDPLTYTPWALPVLN